MAISPEDPISPKVASLDVLNCESKECALESRVLRVRFKQIHGYETYLQGTNESRSLPKNVIIHETRMSIKSPVRVIYDSNNKYVIDTNFDN